MSPPMSLDLSAGGVVVTAGQRLARHLLAEHCRAQMVAGRKVWETPDIIPWPQWLERLWLESADADAGLLLNDSQALALWERVVREDDREQRLLQPAAAARLAAQAWQLVHAWRLPLDDATEILGEDAEAYRRWARRYEEHCRARGFLDEARLADHLIHEVSAGRVVMPARLVLAGFDEFTPQQQALLDALAAQGVETAQSRAPESQARAVRIGLSEAEEEIRSAALWVRARLETNPDARIAVVVPELAARRAAIERALDDALLPGALLAADGEIARPYNISLGLPLSDYPLVHDGLLILELGVAGLTEHRLPFVSVSRLLRSPFLGEAVAEQTQRARLDVRLRRSREPFVGLGWLIAQAGDEEGSPCPALTAGLLRWRELLHKMPRSQSPGRWAASFALLLRALGWPGARTLTSREHQTLEAWRELLSRFAALETVLPAIDLDGAFHELRRLAQERLFQPRTPEVGVQVLGLLEASGLAFDHLWVMGLDAEAWPRPAEPHPLLSIRAQRRHGVPHASPERELEFAQRVTARLLASAGEVIVSHPLASGDRVFEPSPLIAALTVISPDELRAASSVLYRDVVQRASARETFRDDPLPLPADREVRGGTGVLREQSACPFRAFARFRLEAAEPEVPQAGLTAMDRGTLAHRVLEAVWKELGSLARLAALDAGERLAVIGRAVDGALARFARRRPFTFTERFTRLEHERLVALTEDWLALERSRPPFRVLEPEVRRRLRVGALELEAQMDRVDELQGGALAVLDYKTGQARLGDWFGERPKEPQLPLYAVYGAAPGREVAAVCFAKLRRGEQGFAGVARASDLLPGVKTLDDTRQGTEHDSWEALCTHWRAILERLAEEFRAGVMAVDPREPATCRDCACASLCRIHELRERSGHLVLEDLDD